MPYDLMDKEISKLKLETNPSYYDGYTKAIVAKQDDINSRLLCVDIFASGERVDISKYSTKMNVKMPNNKHLATNGQLIDGNLYFRIYDSMLTQIGHISCDVSLYKECINVVADTDGSINYTDVIVEQDTFINKVGDLGSYIFEYNNAAWTLEDSVVTLSDYGITLNENSELFSGDKIIVSYSNYMLLTTETFFIVVQEKNHSEDADIPMDSEGKVFEYINADDVLVAIEQTHIHTNKDILDNTTAIYTTDDKRKLTNIDTSLYIEKSVMGKANGVATLDNSGLVPSAQLPSFVDDTIEGYTTNASAFSSDWLSLTNGGVALIPEKGKIYIVVSDGEYKNKQYRWGGTTYILCNPSDVNSVNGKTGIVQLSLDDISNGNNFVHTTNDFTNDLKTKLDKVEDGAQVNVNADWNAVEGEASYIKNKPLIPEGSTLYSTLGNNTDGAIHQGAMTNILKTYEPIAFAESERQKSKNLFDNTFEFGFYDISDGGKPVYSADYKRIVRKLPIKPNTQYTFSTSVSNPAQVILFYDISLNFISYEGMSGYSTYQFTTPSNAYYFTYYTQASAEADIQVEEGTVATSYVSYYGKISRKGDDEIKFAESERQKIKNLFDITKLQLPSAAIVGNSVVTSTTYNQSSNILKDFANLEVGKDYILTFDTTSDVGYIYLYGDEQSWVRGNTKTITQAMLDNKICIYGNRYTNIGTESVNSNIMIRESTDTDSAYQPYNGRIIHETDINDIKSIRTLPSEYQEVEYIESTGTQYINTGYVTKYGDTVEVEFEYTAINNIYNFLYGATSPTNNDPVAKFGVRYYEDIYEPIMEIVSATYRGSSLYAFNKKVYKMVLASDSQKLYIDGAEVASGTESDVLPNYTAFLFASNDGNNTYVDGNQSNGKLYKASIKSGATLVREFIPCYRKDDGEIGLYDTVNKVFYTNQGDGTFLKGENIYLSNVARRNDAEVVFAESERQKSKNLLKYPYYASSRSSNGVTLTDNGDGTITVNGSIQSESGGNAILQLTDPNNTGVLLKAGNYRLYNIASKEHPHLYVTLWDKTNNVYYPTYTNRFSNIILDKDITGYFYVELSKYATTPADNIVVKPMLLEGSKPGQDSDDEEWQPYNGAITHNGDASVMFAESEREKCINLFNKYAVTKRYELNGNTGVLSANNDYYVSDYINVKGLSTLYLSSTSKTSGRSNCFYDADHKFVSVYSTLSGLIQVPSNAVYMRFNGLLSEIDNNVQVEAGSSPTTYKNYANYSTHDVDIQDTKRIPNEYQEVEYIESTGTQYIDTGVMGKTGVGAEVSLMFTEVPADGSILGSRRDDNHICPFHIYPSKWWYGYGASNSNATLSASANTPYYAYSILKNGTQTLRVNDTPIALSGTSTTDINTNANMYIFAMNKNNTEVIYPSKFKLYMLRIYEGDTLVRDYVPCYRKEDGVAGLYDVVNDKFYINAGSGSFLVGKQTISKYLSFNTPEIFNSGLKIIKNGGVLDRTGSKDASIYCERRDTGVACHFGVGSGGTNHGFYSLPLGRWVLSANKTSSTLTVNEINLLV